MAFESTYANILFAYDSHRWGAEPKECPVCKETHFMTCTACGIRRYGAFAEQGAYHYFEYDQVDGDRHELIPPCSGAIIDPDIAVVDTVEVCDRCQHIIKPAGGICPYAHDREKHGVRKIPFLRSIKPRA